MRLHEVERAARKGMLLRGKHGVSNSDCHGCRNWTESSRANSSPTLVFVVGSNDHDAIGL
jgi:hypothetical protein